MTNTGPIKTLILPQERDIGEFSVRRVLPQVRQRSIGPWVFFDHFGPVDFAKGQGINVRPHPHINLATVTYLFEGEIFHRDSLGTALAIRPGAINLMVAGKGIVHSERTREALRATGYKLHGLQLWMALPESDEEVEPEFHHTPAHEIPSKTVEGAVIRVMMGEAYGMKSPVKTFSPTLYIEADMPDGTGINVPPSDELGVYVVEGEADIDGAIGPVNSMSVLTPEATRITARGNTRLVMIGGRSLGRRYLDWNFVSSRKERVEQAKLDWSEGRFERVPGDDEALIPLPK